MAKHTKKKCRTVRGKRVCKSKTKRAVKGARSKTHKGRLDYTTKKGDKDFHRKGHDEKHAAKSRKARKPYVKSKKGGVGNIRAFPYPQVLTGPPAWARADLERDNKAAPAPDGLGRKHAKKGGADFGIGKAISNPYVCQDYYCMNFVKTKEKGRGHASPLTKSPAKVLPGDSRTPSKAY